MCLLSLVSEHPDILARHVHVRVRRPQYDCLPLLPRSSARSAPSWVQTPPGQTPPFRGRRRRHRQSNQRTPVVRTSGSLPGSRKTRRTLDLVIDLTCLYSGASVVDTEVNPDMADKTRKPPDLPSNALQRNSYGGLERKWRRLYTPVRPKRTDIGHWHR